MYTTARTEFVPTIEKNKNLCIVKRQPFVKLNCFEKNAIVLAKQKYSCAWPARVIEIEKGKVLVSFFGDKRQGFVSLAEVYDFVKSAEAVKSIISSKKPPRGYITGVKEIELLLGVNKEKSLFNEI